MTALKPLENRRVRAVASERYPLNKQCAHPDCNEAAVDPHHAFPRSAIGGDSWFVEIVASRAEVEADPFWLKGLAMVPLAGSGDLAAAIVPHVTGLCRTHHDDAELHRSWIKLEEGVWNWYDRDQRIGQAGEFLDGWQLAGALNPQPGSVEGKPKRKRLAGEARRKRKTISVKVPNDTEDGAAIWDERQAAIKERLVEMELYSEGDAIPNYEAWIAAVSDWLSTPITRGEA